MTEQAALFPYESDDDYMLKHVNAVALMPVVGGRKLSLPNRRLFNVLLNRAQEEGVQEEYTARMHEITKDSEYNSNDLEPIRKALRELMSTTVEWQSPSNGEIETWEACALLSGAGTRKDKKTNKVTIFWRYDSKVREQLLNPDRYARLKLEALTQLSSHPAMALYEICARYIDNPGHRTARRPWRWWRPVLRGVKESDDTSAEYRFFKRDVINKAVAEVNALTNIEIKGPIEYKERDNKTIGDIQFEVHAKDRKRLREKSVALKDLGPADLPVIARAINAGVDQSEVESLIKKHGTASLDSAVGDLEKRLLMPSEKIGQVQKPSSWLKANVERRARETSERVSPLSASSPGPDDIKKHRAAWMDEWLRRRKEALRNEFEDFDSKYQQELLEAFRQELKTTSQPQFLTRFESSGWKHRMLKEVFTKFLGLRSFGTEWDKPTTEEILAIAAELASRKE